MLNETDDKTKLLKHASAVLNSIIKGLDEVDLETRKKIMELCGEACAHSDDDLRTAKKIGEEAADENEILTRMKKELPWCGTWIRKGNIIQSICSKCGCPLVRNKVVNLTERFVTVPEAG